ncbi:hypothetical protein TWF506_005515 [Arthrobotrys conoides]|uniref:Uncharacterized protein n=1 Tax=Arthrobotrys conoides TaxID=74498 RepID=A0AAN8P6Y8_9PEZI
MNQVEDPAFARKQKVDYQMGYVVACLTTTVFTVRYIFAFECSEVEHQTPSSRRLPLKHRKPTFLRATHANPPPQVSSRQLQRFRKTARRPVSSSNIMSSFTSPSAAPAAGIQPGPTNMCTCSLSANDPRRPRACICKYKEREVYPGIRLPKFSLEDVFYILCAVFDKPGEHCGQWRDTILYHFVCEGDWDHSKAGNVLSSLLGRFNKSDYCARIMGLRPSESWQIYDQAKFSRNSLVTRANFVALRDGDDTETRSCTLVNPSDRDRNSIYDSELDYYTGMAGDEDEDLLSEIVDYGEDEDDEYLAYNQYEEEVEYANYEAGNDENDEEDEDQGFYNNPAQPSGNAAAPRTPSSAGYSEPLQSYPCSQSNLSSITDTPRGHPNTRAQQYSNNQEGGDGHITDLPRAGSRAVTSATTESTVTNHPPAPAVVDMINSWAPTVSQYGGEIRISRHGSATIKFSRNQRNHLG